MNNHTDKLDEIIKNNLTTLNVSIEKSFIDPLSQAEKSGDFPYLTFVLGSFTFNENSLRLTQEIDIYGFVKDTEESLDYVRSDLLVKTAKALKKDVKFSGGSMSNLFSKFGLSAFLTPPFGGFRLSGVIAFHLEQLPVSVISQDAANWLALNGARFTFLDGSEAQFLGGG